MRLTLAIVALLTIGPAMKPAKATDFYAGKQVHVRIGGSAGGGYDFYGRMVARHISRHMPGNPTIVSSNMPGADGRVLAAHLFAIAPKDGTEIGIISTGAIVVPLIDANLRKRYDPTKFQYIGTADTGVRVCITWGSSPTKSFEDAQQRKTIVGATALGGAPRDFPVFLNALAGAKFEVVTGYKGTDEILVAMEKGEVEGICGFEWVSLISQKPDWVRDKKINILVQMALDESEEISKFGVPTVWKYLKRRRRSTDIRVPGQRAAVPTAVRPASGYTKGSRGYPARRLRCHGEGRSLSRCCQEGGGEHFTGLGRSGAGDGGEGICYAGGAGEAIRGDQGQGAKK